jgi:hypothetical protein
MKPNDILVPVLAMVLLHAVVWIWMTVTRGRAMSRIGMKLEEARHTSDLQQLPTRPRQVADNYNHLFELPTVFYALVFYIWAMGHVDTMHVWCAWAFFVSRVVHSIVQGTINKVSIRFPIFAVGWILVIIMSIRELLTSF